MQSEQCARGCKESKQSKTWKTQKWLWQGWSQGAGQVAALQRPRAHARAMEEKANKGQKPFACSRD
jgi:hypothetical protein